MEIWKYDGSSWFRANTDGFGTANNESVYALTEYNGNLYAGTLNEYGAQVYRYVSGTTWTKVNIDGFGNPINGAIIEMTVYAGEMYANVMYTNFPGSEIWKYNGSTWTQIDTNEIGAEGTIITDSLFTHNNNLYAGIVTINSAQIWRWNGVRWGCVMTDGFGNPNNQRMRAQETYNGKLYAGTGTFVDDVASVWSWQSIDIYPIYRFWNNTARHHFYTISETEKDFVIANYHEWAYEGVGFFASPAAHPDLSPVYRFWSDRYRGHFYTISGTEKDYVIANLSHDWTYEGVAYYAATTPVLDAMGLFRFWSNNYRGHFYTTSAAERDYVIGNLSHDWAYEGTGYYVF